MNRSRHILLIILVFAAALARAGGGAWAQISEEEKFASKDTIILGPGDQVRIKSVQASGISGMYIVTEDGEIELPVADGIDFGTLNVDGLTLGEAIQAMTDKLSKYYWDPTVDITPMSTTVKLGAKVSVVGAMDRTGAFRYEKDMRMLDLISAAGMYLDKADPKKSLLYRKGEEIPRRIDITKFFDGAGDSINIPLLEGDTLVVPEKPKPEMLGILALGQFSRPGNVQVKKGSRLMDVIAEAGGFVGRAAVGRTYVMRMVDGEPVAIHADIKLLMNQADLMQNVEVEEGDIVFVPESSAFNIDKVLSDLVQFDVLRSSVNGN